MDALIREEERVVCPYCTCDQFIVIRRELKDDSVLIKQCRCQACGDVFQYAENKEGKPIDP